MLTAAGSDRDLPSQVAETLGDSGLAAGGLSNEQLGGGMWPPERSSWLVTDVGAEHQGGTEPAGVGGSHDLVVCGSEGPSLSTLMVGGPDDDGTGDGLWLSGLAS